MKQKRKLSIFAFTLPLITIFLLSALSAPAIVEGQVVYYTPTPDARGRVIYVVQAGDTCTSIALINGISLEDLRLLNDLSGDECIVNPGHELLLAIVEEPTVIPLTPTPTSLFPTPTPFAGYVTICIRLYEDLNGNAVREETEILLHKGAVSITDPLTLESWTGETVYNEELCFEDLPAGEYNISIAVPVGYNSTTVSSQSIDITAGDTAIVNFGAQPTGQIVGEEEITGEPVDDGKSPFLGVIGGLMLIGGGGLGFYMYITSRRRENDF